MSLVDKHQQTNCGTSWDLREAMGTICIGSGFKVRFGVKIRVGVGVGVGVKGWG